MRLDQHARQRGVVEPVDRRRRSSASVAGAPSSSPSRVPANRRALRCGHEPLGEPQRAAHGLVAALRRSPRPRRRRQAASRAETSASCSRETARRRARSAATRRAARTRPQRRLHQIAELLRGLLHDLRRRAVAFAGERDDARRQRGDLRAASAAHRRAPRCTRSRSGASSARATRSVVSSRLRAPVEHAPVQLHGLHPDPERRPFVAREIAEPADAMRALAVLGVRDRPGAGDQHGAVARPGIAARSAIAASSPTATRAPRNAQRDQLPQLAPRRARARRRPRRRRSRPAPPRRARSRIVAMITSAASSTPSVVAFAPAPRASRTIRAVVRERGDRRRAAGVDAYTDHVVSTSPLAARSAAIVVVGQRDMMVSGTSFRASCAPVATAPRLPPSGLPPLREYPPPSRPPLAPARSCLHYLARCV